MDAQAAAADPEAVLQSEPADPGAAHSVAPEHDERGARGAPGSNAAADGSAVLRADSQPRHRDDAARDRGEEPEDASRVGVEPARVQRAARTRPRERRRLQADGRRGTSGAPAAGAADAVQPAAAAESAEPAAVHAAAPDIAGGRHQRAAPARSRLA